MLFFTVSSNHGGFFMRHLIFKICLGLGSVLLTVPVSFATVGGKSYIELLGYEAKDQKLYLLKHNEDASGRLPQLYYFDFKSAQPEQLIEVKSIYPRTKTGEIDYFSDGTDVPFERELIKITRRLKKLYPINPNIFKINVEKEETLQVPAWADPEKTMPEYRYDYTVQNRAYHSQVQQAVSYAPNLEVTQAFRIPKQDRIVVTVEYLGFPDETMYTDEDTIILSK